MALQELIILLLGNSTLRPIESLEVWTGVL
jgi:hypothetical protein